MIRKTDIQNKIIEKIIENKGSRDEYLISGVYGCSYNESMEYLAIYHGEVFHDEIIINEIFFQYDYQLEGTPLQGFFKSTSERVRMNKVRKYINDYMY